MGLGGGRGFRWSSHSELLLLQLPHHPHLGRELVRPCFNRRQSIPLWSGSGHHWHRTVPALVLGDGENSPKSHVERFGIRLGLGPRILNRIHPCFHERLGVVEY